MPSRLSSSNDLLEIDECGETLQRLAGEGVVGPLPALLPLEETRVGELLQVMAHGGLRKLDRGRELADAHRAVAAGEQVDDLHAGRVGERAKQRCGRLGLLL